MLWRYSDILVAIVVDVYLLGYALRKVGPSGFGLFALAGTVTGVFTAVNFGLGMGVVRAAATEQANKSPSDDQAAARREIGTAHAAFVAMGVVCAVGSMALVPLLPLVINVPAGQNKALRVTVVLVGLGFTISVASVGLASLAIGRRCFRLLATASMLGNTVNLAVVLALLGRVGVVALGLGTLLGSAAQCLTLALWASSSVPWLRLWPTWPRPADVKRVAGFALPLLVVTAGWQLVAATDLLAIGAVASTAAVGLYKAASAVPSRASQMLFAGYDVLFPFLAGSISKQEQEGAFRRVSQIFSYLAGVGFAFLVLERHQVVLLLTGHSSVFAEQVLVVFCAVWLVNIPAHGITLILIARGRQRVFIPLVATELSVNIILTIVFVVARGPLAAALVTLATIVVGDYLLLPYVVRREFSVPVGREIVLHSLMPSAVGAFAAIVGAVLARAVGPTQTVAQVIVTGGFTAILGLALAPLLLRADGRRWVRGALRREAS